MPDPSAPAPPTGPASDPLASRPSLRGGVDLVEGLDEVPMLRSPGGERYVRLGGSAAVALVRSCDGVRTGYELSDALARTLHASPTDARDRVRSLLVHLAESGMVDGVPVPTARRPRGEALARALHRTARWQWETDPGAFADAAERTARLVRRVPLAVRRALVWPGAVAATVLIATALSHLHVRTGWPMVLGAVAGLLLHLALHEFSHAVAARTCGVGIRKVGVALWLYVLPVVHVDTNDVYRERSRRVHVLIPAAGPLFDLLAAGAVAAALLTADPGGSAAGALTLLLTAQLTQLAARFNPLFPSDGQRAVEAALGTVNFRGDALSYVTLRLLRQPVPPRFAGLPPRIRRGYWCYLCWLVTYVVLVGLLATWLSGKIVGGSWWL